MILSVLVPSIPERLIELYNLLKTYQSYIDKYNLTEQVELISICDNKKRTIGKKRSDLIAMAQGSYIVISDDDDQLCEKYFELIASEIEKSVDVITYDQLARINFEYSIVRFGHNNPIEDFNKSGITLRPAWHCCTWKREVVRDIKFDDIMWGEDHNFALMANKAAKTTSHIPEICHIYEHDAHLTASFQ
jgi:hypothetical protein